MTINRQGQLGFLGAYIVGLVFFIIWVLFLAGWLRQTAEQGIASGTLTGIEAFFMANINLWIGVVLLLYFVVVSFVGRAQ